MAIDTSISSSSQRTRWLRRLRIAIVTGFVIHQLFFMVFRGALDLWPKTITDWLKARAAWTALGGAFESIDAGTRCYGTFFGIEQGWRIFAGPQERSTRFLTARIDFTDGSEAWVFSENEPDPGRFFRVGGWRQR